MWLMVQFDLPMDSKIQSLAYRRLRKKLRFLGFAALQKSIYLRWEDSNAAADRTMERLSDSIPAEGNVAVLRLSDRTLESSVFYESGVSVAAPAPPEELLLC